MNNKYVVRVRQGSNRESYAGPPMYRDAYPGYPLISYPKYVSKAAKFVTEKEARRFANKLLTRGNAAYIINEIKQVAIETIDGITF